jgi:hypothetical protein
MIERITGVARNRTGIVTGTGIEIRIATGIEDSKAAGLVVVKRTTAGEPEATRNTRAAIGATNRMSSNAAAGRRAAVKCGTGPVNVDT